MGTVFYRTGPTLHDVNWLVGCILALRRLNAVRSLAPTFGLYSHSMDAIQRHAQDNCMVLRPYVVCRGLYHSRYEQWFIFLPICRDWRSHVCNQKLVGSWPSIAADHYQGQLKLETCVWARILGIVAVSILSRNVPTHLSVRQFSPLAGGQANPPV